jgi:hypothetical protein
MGLIREASSGRPHIEVIYKDIDYKEAEYTIMSILKNGENYYSIIDYEDKEKVKKYSWHIASGYIGTAFIHDGKRKELYLHNLIMNKLTFEGKGQIETVDHINRNPLDNRKKNLRILSQSEQNLNQKQKERKIELPEDCEIKSEDIPKHIWYIKANGSHCDRFGIDLKTENIKWKSSSSRKISLKEKLNIAKEQLQEYYKMYPYLDPKNEEKNKIIETLTNSFNDIIKLTE